MSNIGEKPPSPIQGGNHSQQGSSKFGYLKNLFVKNKPQVLSEEIEATNDFSNSAVRSNEVATPTNNTENLVSAFNTLKNTLIENSSLLGIPQETINDMNADKLVNCLAHLASNNKMEDFLEVLEQNSDNSHATLKALFSYTNTKNFLNNETYNADQTKTITQFAQYGLELARCYLEKKCLDEGTLHPEYLERFTTEFDINKYIEPKQKKKPNENLDKIDNILNNFSNGLQNLKRNFLDDKGNIITLEKLIDQEREFIVTNNFIESTNYTINDDNIKNNDNIKEEIKRSFDSDINAINIYLTEFEDLIQYIPASKKEDIVKKFKERLKNFNEIKNIYKEKFYPIEPQEPNTRNRREKNNYNNNKQKFDKLTKLDKDQNNKYISKNLFEELNKNFQEVQTKLNDHNPILDSSYNDTSSETNIKSVCNNLKDTKQDIAEKLQINPENVNDTTMLNLLEQLSEQENKIVDIDTLGIADINVTDANLVDIVKLDLNVVADPLLQKLFELYQEKGCNIEDIKQAINEDSHLNETEKNYMLALNNIVDSNMLHFDEKNKNFKITLKGLTKYAPIYMEYIKKLSPMAAKNVLNEQLEDIQDRAKTLKAILERKSEDLNDTQKTELIQYNTIKILKIMNKHSSNKSQTMQLTQKISDDILNIRNELEQTSNVEELNTILNIIEKNLNLSMNNNLVHLKKLNEDNISDNAKQLLQDFFTQKKNTLPEEIQNKSFDDIINNSSNKKILCNHYFYFERNKISNIVINYIKNEV